jgi:RNA polymerase sigma factor (sigma-70 family)
MLLWKSAGEQQAMSTQQNRVLVVDDETAIVEGVTTLLGLEEIENAGATDRGGAVKILRQRFFPVIITDLRLETVEEGLQLIDDIRRLSPRSRVVVLSAYVTPRTEADLLRRGVAAILHKPAGGDELLAAVRELFEQFLEEAAGQESVDLERLYLGARRKLYAIPRTRFGLTHDQAEDVLQEAWLLFLQKRGLIHSAGPWLAGAVVNLSRQTIDRRVRKREKIEESELLELHADNTTGDLADILAMRRALQQVDDRSRLLCSLIGIEGHSYEEVSAATGMPLGSIGPLYLRAKKKLRGLLSH